MLHVLSSHPIVCIVKIDGLLHMKGLKHLHTYIHNLAFCTGRQDPPPPQCLVQGIAGEGVESACHEASSVPLGKNNCRHDQQITCEQKLIWRRGLTNNPMNAVYIETLTKGWLAQTFSINQLMAMIFLIRGVPECSQSKSCTTHSSACMCVCGALQPLFLFK